MIERLDAPAASGHCERWVEGTYIAFGFVESPPGYVATVPKAAHEQFVYVIRGSLEAEVGNENRRCEAGGVIQIPKGQPYQFKVMGNDTARYAAVRSTSKLEEAIAQKGAADNWRG